MAGLLVPETAVDIAARQQLFVPPNVFYSALLEHKNRVGRHQGRQAVRDDDQCAAVSDARNIRVDDRLAVCVERARRFVEDQDARVDDQCTRDRQALSLPAGKIWRAFINMGFITARQPFDELLGAGQARCADDFIEGRVDLAGSDVFADRSAEQEILLQNHAEAAAQVIDVVFAHVDAVDLDQSLVIGMKALQQPRDRGLSRSASAHDAQGHTLRHIDRHVLSRLGPVRPGYLNVTFENWTCPSMGVRTPWPERPSSGRLIDKIADNGDRNSRFIVLIDQLGHLQQRAGHALRQHQEGEERADINRVVGAKAPNKRRRRRSR